MDGFLPNSLTANVDGHGDGVEDFVKVVEKILESGSSVELELLPSAVLPVQVVFDGNKCFLAVTKSSVRSFLMNKNHQWMEHIFLSQSERTWRHLRNSPHEDPSWQLLLTKLALEVLPKALEPFAHRRWLFRHRYIKLDTSQEWELVYRCARKHKANYHCWDHARWLYDQSPPLFDLVEFSKLFKSQVTDCSISSFAAFLMSHSPHRQHVVDMVEELWTIHKPNKVLFYLMTQSPGLLDESRKTIIVNKQRHSADHATFR